MKNLSLFFILIVIGVALVAIYSNSGNVDPTPDKAVTEPPHEWVTKTKNNAMPESDSSLEVSISTEAWVGVEQDLKDGEEQLAELIEAYNNNLDNPEKRAQLEARMARISQAYKRAVLAKVKSSHQTQEK